MANIKVPVIAITDTEILVFDSVVDCATNYGCRPSHITNLIERNQVFRDGRTCFDYLEEKPQKPIQIVS